MRTRGPGCGPRSASPELWGLVATSHRPGLSPGAARRALTAYNLVSFEGAYSIQWGIGLVIDQFQSLGWAIQASFRGAFAILAIGGAPARAWFVGTNDSIRLSRVRSTP